MLSEHCVVLTIMLFVIRWCANMMWIRLALTEYLLPVVTDYTVHCRTLDISRI